MSPADRGRGDAPPAGLRAAGRAVALGAALALIVTGCGSAGPTPAIPAGSPTGALKPTAGEPPVASGGGPIPVILDTDLDADDLRALAYLAARPAVDLRAVTVAGTGVVRCPTGVAIARAVLARLDRASVPVACGRSTPLSGSAAFPKAWRDRADAAIGLDLAGLPAADASPVTAVDLLTSAIERAPGPVHLIVIGPATNIAEALAAQPKLAGRIGVLTMMGGALDVPGNVAGAGVADANHAAEWNVFADPAAWQAVLDAGLGPTIVPLDATNAVPVTQAAFLSIAANRAAPPAKLVFDLIDANPELLTSEQSFWDSLASLAAFDPAVVGTVPATVRVVQASGNELGRLVEDATGAAVTIATTANAAAFEDRFVSALNGGAAVAPVPEPATRLDLTFDGTSCGGRIPASIPTGFVSLALDNRSLAGAGGGLFVLADGVTVDEVLGAITTNPDGVRSMGRIVATASADAGTTGRGVGIATRTGTAFAGCLTWGATPRLLSAGTLAVVPRGRGGAGRADLDAQRPWHVGR